ncbi:MAG: threonine--tRNA ligase, partial [Planctomycetes bacterium]|nr:threonine--tRNA ligase [Planctomycetota bacterium]
MSQAAGAAMVTVTLPDGSSREVARGTRVVDLASAIGPGLGKATLGAKLNGEAEIIDLRTPLEDDCRIEIVTKGSLDGLAVLRHSASHVMAEAILRVWPEAKLSIGPSTDQGFYYDIDLEHRVSEDDLARIEDEMKAIVKADSPFERCTIEREASLKRFREAGEIYKVELIEGFEPEAELSVYQHGNGSFEDLCRGPHVPSTGWIKAFKLLKVAGAYWRGDENRQVLQRIYGTAFFDKKELAQYLERIEEAKRRDHRKLGKELGLFMFHPWAPASPFFLAPGAKIYNLLVDYMREKYRHFGYQEVITPQIFDVELWKRSGHWDKYKDNMYFTQIEKSECGVKPMNCPSHTLIFGSTLHSYRDLPVRMADFGRLHRYERSGVTGGLTRVRTFCQDDAHIFCREDQIQSEISGVIRLLRQVYDDFRFTDLKIYLSTRPEKSVGSDEVWEKAEEGLAKALQENKLDYTVNPGDGAFYGPKIDFVVLDALEREWQLGTVQLDFIMPERFELEYDDAQGGRSQPVMIHRAIMGSIERFLGILIEHFAGVFPVWLAPVQ